MSKVINALSDYYYNDRVKVGGIAFALSFTLTMLAAFAIDLSPIQAELTAAFTLAAFTVPVVLFTFGLFISGVFDNMLERKVQAELAELDA